MPIETRSKTRRTQRAIMQEDTRHPFYWPFENDLIPAEDGVDVKEFRLPWIEDDAVDDVKVVDTKCTKRKRSSSRERQKVVIYISSDEDDVNESSDDDDDSKREVQVKRTRRMSDSQRAWSGRSSKPIIANLPQGTQKKFRFEVLQRLYQYLASKEAWASIPNSVLLRIWNEVFPAQNLTENSKTFRVVQLVARSRVQRNWIRGFKTAAIQALEDTWKALKLYSKAERAKFVTTMLGVAANKEKKRVKLLPFMFSSAYEKRWSDAPKEDCKFEGIFLGPLLLRTFARYIRLVGLEHYKSHKPKSALVMSIQAVQHVLSYSRNGKIAIPLSKRHSPSEFSANNYKDYPIIQEGRVVMIKRSSLWDAGIDSLEDEDWKKIIVAASEYNMMLQNGPTFETGDLDVAYVDSGDDQEGDAALLITRRRV